MPATLSLAVGVPSSEMAELVKAVFSPQAREAAAQWHHEHKGIGEHAATLTGGKHTRTMDHPKGADLVTHFIEHSNPSAGATALLRHYGKEEGLGLTESSLNTHAVVHVKHPTTKKRHAFLFKMAGSTDMPLAASMAADIEAAVVEAAAPARDRNTKEKDAIMEQDFVQCRAAVGTAIRPEKPWIAGEPVSFIYAPEGVHTITAGFRKADTITICVAVDEETVPALQESFDHLCATQPKQEPYGDEDHESKKATVRFPAGQTRFSWGVVKGDPGVIVSGGSPTSYGAESVNGKVYRSWSPEFMTDADMGKAKRNEDGHWTFPDGVRGSEANPARLVGVNFVVGALTNRPAFRGMPPVKAKQAQAAGDTVKAVGTSEGARKGWEHRTRADASAHLRNLRKQGYRGNIKIEHDKRNGVYFLRSEDGSLPERRDLTPYDKDIRRMKRFGTQDVHGALTDTIYDDAEARAEFEADNPGADWESAAADMADSFLLMHGLRGHRGMQASDASGVDAVKAGAAGFDVCLLAAYAASVQAAHWAADTSGTVHEALGDLYDEMRSGADRFAEVYGGKTGRLPVASDSYGFDVPSDYGQLIEEGIGLMAKAKQELVPGVDDELLSIVADMEEALGKARYLLKATDETGGGDRVAASGTSEGAVEGWKKRRFNSDVHIRYHSNAAQFAKDYHAGEQGNFRSGGPVEGDEKAAEKLWTDYERVSSKPRFAGTGSELWKHKASGKHFHIESSPTGKGFYGMEQVIEEAKPHHMSLHGVKADDAITNDAVKASGTSAGAKFQAFHVGKMKSHGEEAEKFARQAVAHRESLLAHKVSEGAWKVDFKERHQEAAEAHGKAAELHKKAGNSELEQSHQNMRDAHAAIAAAYDKEPAQAKASHASINDIVLKSSAVTEKLLQRRGEAEALIGGKVPKKVERGPAKCAGDVLDDLRVAAIKRNGKQPKVLAQMR